MGIIDNHEVARQEAMKEAYDELKENLSEDRAKNFYFLMVLNEMEQKIEEQEEKIKEYKSFFSLLKSFLPKSFSSHTLIG